MAEARSAVVTGGNKGVGLGACRLLARAGVRVALTARDPDRGAASRRTLAKEGLDVLFHPLDVTDGESVARLAEWAQKELGGPDILINNAAILLDRERLGLDVGIDSVRETMETNLYGPLRLCQALAPGMKRRRYGRIVNVSSWFGGLEGMEGGYPGYRISKTCLNALTCILAAELRGGDILVNAACPGWVRTDMGGRSAPRSPEEGADTPVWLALLPKGGPTGGFFQDRKPHPW
ncbi:MAG: SDR family oxidoreductase [bacterium]